MDPYSEGRNVNRTRSHDNPYPPGSTAWNMWEDGYEDAYKERRRKKGKRVKDRNTRWMTEDELLQLENDLNDFDDYDEEPEE